MVNKLSVIIAAAVNDRDIIEDTLQSIVSMGEIIVVCSGEQEKAFKELLNSYGAKRYTTYNNLGHQRELGIKKAKGNWILILDTDERVSSELKKEIIIILQGEGEYSGYFLPYQNYFLNHQLISGNQRYEKLRLFTKKKGTIEKLKTHPEIYVKGNFGHLKGTINHYSFRSFSQIFKKFTYYAQEDTDRLRKSGEVSSLLKLIINPMHMFHALFVKDKGYLDGIWGFLLAGCFAYYELMRYYFLLYSDKKKHPRMPAL